MAEFVSVDDLKQPFPWYVNDIRKQNRFKRGTYDCYKLITLPNMMQRFVIPFKFSDVFSPFLPTQWLICDQNGTVEMDLTAQIPGVLTGVHETERDANGYFN